MGSIFDRGVMAADPCAPSGHGALAIPMSPYQVSAYWLAGATGAD